MSREKYHKRWLRQSVAGLLLVSAGLCMTIESALLKYEGILLLEWLLAGTVSLIVFNAGLCLLIDSVRFRMLRDQAED
ncbi:MAG: hypothetical protein AAGI23_02635 [Bacteroidota bacterium]